MKVVLDMFVGDALRNNFMHCCDVFEKGKQLAEYSQMGVEGDDIKLDLLIEQLRELINDVSVKRNLVFLGIREVDGVLTNNYKPFIKEGVQSISDGHQWGMFHKMLETVGYKVETNQYMAVLSAELIITVPCEK